MQTAIRCRCLRYTLAAKMVKSFKKHKCFQPLGSPSDNSKSNVNNWRARCKNGLSDDFGATFTKPPNYLLSGNVTVAKWMVSCSQHIVLVIWIEFPPKLYQVTLLLARKVKLPKCQEIPIISAGSKKQFCCCPWWMWLKKKKIANLTCSNGLPRQEKLFQKLFALQNGKFCFTGNSPTFSD